MGFLQQDVCADSRFGIMMSKVMAYNLNSWRDLLVSGFAFAVANPALIVLHSKKNFAVDGRNYVSMTGRELANVCRIYVNVNSDNNAICCGSEWDYGLMGSKGVIIVCWLQFCLVAVMARRVLAPREHKCRKNRKISRVFLCFFSGLHYLCKQKLNDGSY